MGGKSLSRALVLAFATHGVLIAALATKARRPPVDIAEVETIEQTLDLEPIQVDRSMSPEPVHARPSVTPSAPAPIAKPVATPTLAMHTSAEQADTSEPSVDTSGSSNSEDSVGTEGVASPQTAAASSLAPVATHGPILLGRDGCRHYFPHGARSEEGTVTVAIDVSPTGTPAGTRLVQESPARNGFGEAAARCATSLHFVPAIDESGLPVRAVATLELRFARSRRRDTLSLR